MNSSKRYLLSCGPGLDSGWYCTENSGWSLDFIPSMVLSNTDLWVICKEVGKLSTDRIMDAGESTLKKFQERGGIITTLSGAEKAKFDKLMKDEVMPAMAKMMGADALLAAQEYAKNN